MVNLFFTNWYSRPDSNRHGLRPTDFKSVMSTNSITRAILASAERFELPTHGLEGRCSIQLS